MPTLLLYLLILPLATAVLVAALGPARGDIIRRVSLISTLGSLALAAILAIDFASQGREDRAGPPGFAPSMVTRWDLLPMQGSPGEEGAAIQFYIGVDGLNIWLVVLTALLMVPCVLVSWTAIEERTHEFYAWLLALQTGMTGVFLAFDIVLFYVFFELTLVPLFFLIGIWGGPQRQYAARKFFIYTLAASLITLLGVLGVILVLFQERVTDKVTFSIPQLVRLVQDHSQKLPEDVQTARKRLADTLDEMAKAPPVGGVDSAADRRLRAASKDVDEAESKLAFWRKVQLWVFAALMCGFAVKVPLAPLHTWLPLAHVEAPTAGSVLLAGVLLKIGVYGFLRLCVPLAPDASLTFGAPLISVLAVLGIIYGSFCALAQDDIKKLVAYSSVAHLGFCMLGLFALNEAGLSGSLLQMINHGLSTGALFLLVGMLYERYHTRKMADYGGMASRLHLLGAAMVFITMTSVGLPGLNGFVGETLVLFGMYDFQGNEVNGRLLASLACFGVLLGAWYMLTMVRGVFFGEVKEPHHHGHGPRGDLNLREIFALAPIALVCVALGVYPKAFLDVARPDLQALAHMAGAARQRALVTVSDKSLVEKTPARADEKTAANRIGD
jgi:NADH-quinone oxidoreductase subunit M